jgi:(E)-4-hydroxy-3-methylbut-2-enyl-diphosphate synthase
LSQSSERKKTRQIHIGQVLIGGDAPIAVQSMTNTDTRQVPATIRQIKRLEQAGCEIVRLAVLDQRAAEAIQFIKQKVKMPIIADIHFDYRLALAALQAGVDGLRINPGNIGGPKSVEKVIKEAKTRDTAIRIGVNSGSLQKEILKKYGRPTPEAMVESALEYIQLFENLGFSQIKLSLKSSHVLDTISAYELLSQKVDYPLHLGITEAGTLLTGTVKSALGIGMLLHQGIGDTLRVSLSCDPVKEIKVAYEILRALGLRQHGPEIISCPTCGRTEINLFKLVKKVEKALAGIQASPKVAIMGCVVNGPGEAREADIGIAGGRGHGILFKKGKLVKKVPEAELADVLIKEVREMIASGFGNARPR